MSLQITSVSPRKYDKKVIGPHKRHLCTYLVAYLLRPIR